MLGERRVALSMKISSIKTKPWSLVQADLVIQSGHIDRNIDRIAVSELIVRSEEVEQVVLIDLIVLNIPNMQACAALMRKIGLLVMSDVMALVLLRAIVSRAMLLWQMLSIVAETLPRCVIVMVML